VPGTSHAPPVSALTHVPHLKRVKAEEGQRSPIDNLYTQGFPHTVTLIHRVSLDSISQKRPTAVSCSATTTTTTTASPAPGAPRSLEARTHRSSSNAVTAAIQQSSFEFASPSASGSVKPLAAIVQERPEIVSLPPGGIPPHLLVPPSSHSSPQSTRNDPPPNGAPTVNSERQKGTATQNSSNSLPRSEEKKVPLISSQSKFKRPTKACATQKQSSTKFAPSSVTPSQPAQLGPEVRQEAPSRLMMPGAFPGTSLDGVDVSSWVLVSPVGPDCQVEVSKRNWFKRMLSRFG
jgi:hypothetical protein